MPVTCPLRDPACHPHHRDVQYEASSGFSFRIGGLYKTWFAQGVHLVRNEELDPYMQEGIQPGAWYGIDTWDPVLQQQVEWTAAMYQGSHPGWGNARSLEARSDAPRTKRPQGKVY